MLHCRAKFLFVILVSILWGVRSAAQATNRGDNNPYSKYGIGELSNGNNAVLRGMANMTSTFKDPCILNSDNPASYSFLQRTTFELGGTASSRTISGSGLTYRTGSANLSYLSLGFPINKNAGMSIGFKPYSHIYYNTVDTITGTSNPPSPIGQTVRTYNGEGGLNYAYLGAGAKYKELSIGFNVGYMFGTIRNTAATVPIDSIQKFTSYVTEFTKYARIGGLQWKGGLMYEHKLDSDYTFRLGGTITINQKLGEHFNAYEISSMNLGDTLINDTTSNPGEKHGKLTLPMSFSIGAMLARNNKWEVGVDFTSAQWSGFNSAPDTIFNVGVGSSAYKISIGGQYTPDMNSIRNYLARVTYRLGFYYGTDYLKLYNTVLPCYGVTAGASLPFRRSQSQLHFAVDVGRLGTTTNGLMQQGYFKFTLGVSISERWFIKKKYD